MKRAFIEAFAIVAFMALAVPSVSWLVAMADVLAFVLLFGAIAVLVVAYCGRTR